MDKKYNYSLTNKSKGGGADANPDADADPDADAAPRIPPLMIRAPENRDSIIRAYVSFTVRNAGRFGLDDQYIWDELNGYLTRSLFRDIGLEDFVTRIRDYIQDNQ